MRSDSAAAPAYVIKPEELCALNYLAPDHPRPQLVEWINRGTNQTLRPSSVDMLLRTLFVDMASPSVVRLHRTSGLRAVFRDDRERNLFAAAFATAREKLRGVASHHVTAIFNHLKEAEQAVVDLKEIGVAPDRISLMFRASQFIDTSVKRRGGHSKLSIAGATAGGGVAAVIFAMAVLAIPGIGPVAAAGAIAGSAMHSFAAASGVLGATGGAIARMLTDHDVDGVSASYYQEQIRRGKIVVSVDVRDAPEQRELARGILKEFRGRTSRRA
jgi:hypothetical protein